MVVFVGDKPSRLNTDPARAFIGTPSFRNLARWIDLLDISNYALVNSWTHDDQVQICQYVNTGTKKFVALGNNASKVLQELGIEHVKLPHPSPRNRKLNDRSFIDLELDKCYNYLRGQHV